MNPVFFDIFDGNLLDNNITNGTGLDDNIVLDNGNDSSNGGAGNDLIYGNGGNDTLVGGAGIDTLNGGDGNDVITSDGDGGTYRGDAGNDTLFSGIGNEAMDGGAGTDTIDHTAWAGNYVFNLATGLTNFAGESFINFENANMGAGNDSVTGNASANLINGGAGNDTINGGAGNDTLVGGAGVDTLNGGDGNDVITSDGDGGTYRGDAGNDTLFSGIGNEAMDGGAGTDTIDHTAWAGNYVFNLATGLTNFAGESFINFENANMGAGNDSVTGNASANLINGGAGNDSLDGRAGNDTLDGGANNDTYLFDTALVLGSDRLIDASGIDTLNFAATTTKTINLNLGSTAAQTVTAGNLTLTLASATAFENVIGGSLNDTIVGNTLANSLTGGAGNDSLSGGDGDDTLIGGSGTDTMTDGAGNDIYRFLSVSDSQVGAARDVLTDFTPGFDKIDLSAIDANTTIAGDQAFTFVGTGAIGIGGQVNYFISGSSLIVQAEIEGDGNLTVDMQIQLNGGLSAIAATDFIL